MRSKAQFKGHPIHPMLVAFPVSFITAAPLFDLAGLLKEWETAWTVGAYASVATVVTGLVAAMPGMIDYLYVVPPKSSAKRTATYHMLVNGTALTAMAASWFFRDWITLRPQAMAVALEALGLGFMSVGGWLGGTLVFRNQIGVDHRYAEAGKWREETVEGSSGESAEVEGANELKVGQMMLVHVNGRRVVLARTEDGLAAFDDHCTHRGGSLADGTLSCGTVCCPWHGSQFDTRDGSVKAGPAEKAISTYQVEQSKGRVRIHVPPKPRKRD